MESGIKRIMEANSADEANRLLKEGWELLSVRDAPDDPRFEGAFRYALGKTEPQQAAAPESEQAAPERKFLFMRDGKDAPEGIEWGEGVRPIRYIPGMCACVARHLMHMESAKADAVSVQYDPNDPELDPDAPEFNFEKYEAAVMPILIPKYREAGDKANRDFARKELEALRREGLLPGTASAPESTAES